MPPDIPEPAIRAAAGRAVTVAVRVRKARHRSVCALCRAPIVTGQQISSDGSSWAHIQCFIADRRNRMTAETVQYSYGEVGHDPPVHAVAGDWQGPAAVARSAAVNISLCGKRLSRARKRQPDQHDLCRRCEELMTQPDIPPAGGTLQDAAADTTPSPNSLVHDYDGEEIVQLGQMFVDRGRQQQRSEQSSWIKKIASEFSWVTCNLTPIAVSARPDGRYHVMDGQHRVQAAKLAGYPPETPVRVRVWRGLTFEEEAVLFVELNAKRHSVKPLDLFRAQVTAGEGDAAAIDVLLDVYGWKIGSAGREGNFAAVTTLRRIHNRPGGPEVCDHIIATITKAWGLNPDGANQNVVKMLGAFYEKHGSADVARLAHVLKHNVPPAAMHVWTREKPWLKVAVVRLEELYNKGLRDPQRRLGSPQR